MSTGKIGTDAHPLCVWGETVSRKKITLFDGTLTRQTLHLPGYPTSRIEASSGIIGAHYNKWDDVAVHTIDAEFSYLDDWARITGLAVSFDPAEQALKLTARPSEETTLAQWNGFKISVIHSINTRPEKHRTTVQEHCELRVYSDVAKPISEFDKILRSFGRFLSLAVGLPARALRTVAKTPEQIGEYEGKPLWREIEIICELMPTRGGKVAANGPLFTLQNSIAAAPGTLARFLDAESLLMPVFELFFPTYFFDLPPPQELLNLAHAIEALHRSTIGGQYQSDVEYQTGLQANLLAALPPSIPSDFRASLARRFEFLHQYSMKKRLKDIIRKFEPLISPHIGKRDIFIQQVTDARNQLVHASSEAPAPDYARLWEYSQQLGLILEIAILAQIGFEEGTIRDIMSRSRRAELIRLNIDLHPSA